VGAGEHYAFDLLADCETLLQQGPLPRGLGWIASRESLGQQLAPIGLLYPASLKQKELVGMLKSSSLKFRIARRRTTSQVHGLQLSVELDHRSRAADGLPVKEVEGRAEDSVILMRAGE
jgi:hypothetical protein